MERLVWQRRLDTEPGPGDLLRLLQDLAGEDATRRGAGRSDLLKQGCVWVLVKNRLEIARWPRAGESVTLTTWPMQGRRGLYPRAFELRGEAGEPLVRADSLWAIIDVESRAMLSFESRGLTMEGVEEGRFSLPPRLRVPEGGESRAFTPRPEQIDENEHMNNAAYLDLAEERLPAGLRGREIASVAIDYEHELPAGQSAELRVVPEADACYFEGKIDDAVCFRLKLEFR